MDRVKEESPMAPKQKSSTPSFLIKTFDILENPEYQQIITWTPDGSGFVIKNISQLIEKVLPNHFKHNNYASFVRQLNMYDFHKLKNDVGQNEFHHKYFVRTNRELLCEIKRKSGEIVDQEEKRNSSQGSNDSNEPDMHKLKNDYQFFLNEMLGIKGKQHELQKALILIMTQNDHLINENKLLWQEIKRIRETDERKIDTLSYLLATFITNMSSNNPQQMQNHLQVNHQNFDNNNSDQNNSKDAKPDMHSSFIEKIIKTQQAQEQQLQSSIQQPINQVKADITSYDNQFMKKNCNPFTRQNQDQQFLVQQNSSALLQQLINLSQQQQSQQQQQQHPQIPYQSQQQFHMPMPSQQQPHIPYQPMHPNQNQYYPPPKQGDNFRGYGFM